MRLVYFRQPGVGISLSPVETNPNPKPKPNPNGYNPLSGRDERGSTIAILLINNGHSARTLSFKLSKVPGLTHVIKGCEFYDVWEKRVVGHGSFWQSIAPVAPHDSIFFTLSGCE